MKNSLFGKVVLTVLAIFLLIAGFRMTDSFLNNPSDEKIEVFRKFCKDGIQTTAQLDSQFIKTTYKLLKHSSGAEKFTLKYNYTVNGRQYRAQNTSARLPENPSIQITYLAGKPEVTTLAKDPCRQYEEEKERQKPFYYLVVGGILMLAGVGLLSNLFTRIEE